MHLRLESGVGHGGFAILGSVGWRNGLPEYSGKTSVERSTAQVPRKALEMAFRQLSVA